MSNFFIWLGLSLGGFVYQAFFKDAPVWSIAIERSWWMAVGIICVSLLRSKA